MVSNSSTLLLRQSFECGRQGLHFIRGHRIINAKYGFIDTSLLCLPGVRQTEEAFPFLPVAFEDCFTRLIFPVNWHTLHRLVAFILATNYFAFQVELFEEEYEANHPKSYDSCSITQPTLSWESFDKENAPQAFVFDAGIQSQFLFLLEREPVALHLPFAQYQPIHDKSPPAA